MTITTSKCTHCGAFTSDCGLSLVVAEGGEIAWCRRCGVKREGHWFPLLMPSVLDMGYRVPWVPTEREVQWWRLWKLDEYLAKRPPSFLVKEALR